MTDLKSQFETAAAEVQTLPTRPDNEILLKLYALYKQATAGDVQGKRPGFTNPMGRAKYDAWKKLRGLSQEDAMQQYAEVVETLKNQG